MWYPVGTFRGTRWISYIVGESGVCGLILPSAVRCREGRREGRKEGRERTLDCCFEKSQGKMEPTVAMSAKSNGVIATAHQPSTPLAHNFISFPFSHQRKKIKFLWLFVTWFKLSAAILWFWHTQLLMKISLSFGKLMMMMMLLPKVSWQ